MANNNFDTAASGDLTTFYEYLQSIRKAAGIFKLPNEVLERIAECLVPGPEERGYTFTEPQPPKGHHDDFKDWKARLSSFRLTCRTFAALHTPKKDLFFTFYWLPTVGTTHRFRGLINDIELARLVRRVVFVQARTASITPLFFGPYGAGPDMRDAANDLSTDRGFPVKSVRNVHFMHILLRQFPNLVGLAFATMADPNDPPRCYHCGFPTELGAPSTSAFPKAFQQYVKRHIAPTHDCDLGSYQVRGTWNAFVESGICVEDITMRIFDGNCQKCNVAWLAMDVTKLKRLNISGYIDYRTRNNNSNFLDGCTRREVLSYIFNGFRRAVVFAQLEELCLSGVAAASFYETLPYIAWTQSPLLKRLKLSHASFGKTEHLAQVVMAFSKLSDVTFCDLLISSAALTAWYEIFQALRQSPCSSGRFLLLKGPYNYKWSWPSSLDCRIAADLQAFIAKQGYWTTLLDDAFLTSRVADLERGNGQ